MTEPKKRPRPGAKAPASKPSSGRFRPAARRRLLRMRAGHALALVGILAVLGIARPPAGDTDWMVAPFSFQEPGGPPLLLVRVGLLFFAMHALRRDRTRALLVVFVFLLSLAAKGAVYPFVLVAVALSVQRLVTSRSVNTLLYGAVAGALGLALLPFLKTPTPPPDERDPAKMVEYWRGRRNPYQARWWAVAWAKKEAQKPGEGLLTLAELDWELGRQASARKMIGKLVDHPGSDEMHERAVAELARWDRDSPAPRAPDAADSAAIPTAAPSAQPSAP